MFRTSPGPSSGVTTVFMRHLVLVLYSWLSGKQNPTWCVFSQPCTKLTLHRNHRSVHLKTEHTGSLYLLRRHLGNWPRSKHKKRIASSAWETRTVAAADGVSCASLMWEINFLLTFETVPFFCVYSVLTTTYIKLAMYHFLYFYPLVYNGKLLQFIRG